MTDIQLGSRRFMEEVWRKQPLKFSRAIAPEFLEALGPGRFRAWCRPPVRSRIYIRTEESSRGTATARMVPDALKALAIYDRYSGGDDPITLLLNGPEKVEPLLRELQLSFGIPFKWRREEAVATLSSAGAGIGYHAGGEDGFLVQLRGRRLWSIWTPEALSPEYRRFLCGGTEERLPGPRPHKAPLLSVELIQGDVLYVPALFPHEGITSEDSMALSLAWRGCSLLHAYRTISSIEAVGQAAPLPGELEDALCALADDPPPEADPINSMFEIFSEAFSILPDGQRPAPAAIAAFVERYVGAA